MQAFRRTFRGTPSLYGEYESWGWTSVPRDERRWGDLVHAVAEHFVRRYGARRTSEWYWEFWNEPDIVYWDGSVEEYCRYYDVTAAAVRRALPGARVGAGDDRRGDSLPRAVLRPLRERGRSSRRRAGGAA